MTVRLTALFESGTDGAAASNANTGASSTVNPAGTMTISTLNAAEGTRSLRCNDITNTTERYVIPNATIRKASGYLTFVQASDVNIPIFNFHVGAAVAGQLSIMTDGQLRIRDANNGTGAALALSVFTMVPGTQYRIEQSLLGNGDYNLQVWGGTHKNETTVTNRLCNITCTLAATTFDDVTIGIISATGATIPLIYHWDRVIVDDVTMPTPLVDVVQAGEGNVSIKLMVGGTTAAFAKAVHVRLMVGGVAKVVGIVLNAGPVVPPPSGILIPPSGAWMGVSAPAVGSSGTSAAGVTQYKATVDPYDPQFLRFYRVNAWNGLPPASDITLENPSGLPRRLLFESWKISDSNDPLGMVNWASVANGSRDARINSAAANYKTHPHKRFLSIWHEPENDLGGAGMTEADWAAMFRHVRTLFDAAGVTNAVWCANYMGPANFSPDNWTPLWPGDTYVDWIWWDPYAHNGNTAITTLLNKGAPLDFFTWATTPRAGFSGTKPLGLGEWGIDFPEYSGSQAITFLNNLTASVRSNYSQIKAWTYWNQDLPSADNYYKVDNVSAAVKTALRNFLQSMYTSTTAGQP